MDPTLPPGPTGPSVVQLMKWIWSPIPMLEALEAKHGDCFTVRLPGMHPNVVFSDPQAVKDLFTASADEVRVKELSGLLRPVLGENSVMLLDGVRHLRQRKLMMPAFHGERMRAYGTMMQRSTLQMLARWPVERPFAFLEQMHAVTLEIILHSIVGVRDDTQLEPMRKVVTRFLKLGTSPVATAALLATPARYAEALLYRPVTPRKIGPLTVNPGAVLPWAAAVMAQREMDKLFYAELAARRAQGPGAASQDVLSMLMAAKDDQGHGLSDVELRDELVTLLLAGHETTATTLAWALYYLLSTPEVLKRLRDELTPANHSQGLDLEAVVKNDYLDSILRETMRLSPVALVVGRHLAAPVKLGKWELPAGVNALACLYLTQRRADLWEEPARFRPERWEGRKNNPYDFFPFGGGARRCLGMAFAYYEMKIILAEVAMRAALRFADQRPIRAERKSIVFAPSRGLPVILGARAA